LNLKIINFEVKKTLNSITGSFGTIFRWLSEFVRNEQIITETKRKFTQPPFTFKTVVSVLFFVG